MNESDDMDNDVFSTVVCHSGSACRFGRQALITRSWIAELLLDDRLMDEKSRQFRIAWFLWIGITLLICLAAVTRPFHQCIIMPLLLCVSVLRSGPLHCLSAGPWCKCLDQVALLALQIAKDIEDIVRGQRSMASNSCNIVF